MSKPLPSAAPVTAPEWLALALSEHRGAAEHTGSEREHHLDTARAAYQQVLDLYDVRCLPAAVRGLEALAAQQANTVAVARPGGGTFEVAGHVVGPVKA